MDPSWLRYSNQGATRNMPLDPRLVNAMSFLGPMGITMDVFSGGQPSSGPHRTGSHRHDLGGAGDVMFMRNGQPISWSNPADVPVFEDIVRQARAAGVTGFGAGEGYMRPGSMHLGFGTPAVWGAGGSGANAPGWLRDAFGGAAQGTVPAVTQTASAVSPLAQSFGRSAAVGAGQGIGDVVGQNAMMPGLDMIGLTFLQQAEARRDRENAEREAEQQRRIAMFSPPAGVAGLYA